MKNYLISLLVLIPLNIDAAELLYDETGRVMAWGGNVQASNLRETVIELTGAQEDQLNINPGAAWYYIDGQLGTYPTITNTTSVAAFSRISAVLSNRYGIAGLLTKDDLLSKMDDVLLAFRATNNVLQTALTNAATLAAMRTAVADQANEAAIQRELLLGFELMVFRELRGRN